MYQIEILVGHLHLFRYNKLSSGASTTKTVLSDAGSRTASAARNAGSVTAKKLGEIRYHKQLNGSHYYPSLTLCKTQWPDG